MAKVNARTSTRAKRARTASRRRASPKPRPRLRRRRPEQAFTVSHYREEDFKTGGLRNYAAYRDLGTSRATQGMVQAHVIRFIPPCRPEIVSKRHYHDVDFQLIYVLKGWIKTDIDGHGANVMRAGSCWVQPPRAEHAVLDYSDDCEVLEIVLPADFKTVELE